jgi:hypothetical protein
MKYGNNGSCKGPGYSAGKSMANTDLSGKQSVKVGRSAGLSQSNLSDQASGMKNKAGNAYGAKVDVKNRKGQ